MRFLGAHIWTVPLIACVAVYVGEKALGAVL